MEFFRDELSPIPRVKLTKEIMVSSKIPQSYWKCELAKIPPKTPHLKPLLDYVTNLQNNDIKGKGLFLYGAYGTGKTGAAVSIVKEVMRRGGRSIFASSLELEPVFGKHLDAQFRTAILSTHYLILDDLGAEKAIPWSPMWTETIIKLRNNHSLPTLITSNEKPMEFCTRIKSVASILGGNYDAINLSGIDWRMDPPEDSV